MPKAAKRTRAEAGVQFDTIRMHRAMPRRDVQKRDHSVFQRQVTNALTTWRSELEKEHAAIKRFERSPEFVRQEPNTRVRDKAFLRYGRHQAGLVTHTFEFTISDGSQIVAPPYDREFENNNPREHLSWYRNYGEWGMQSIPDVADGGAGIGIYLTSSNRSLAAITPIGTYDFSIVAVEDAPNLWLRGGLAMTVYSSGVSTPDQNRKVILWNLHGLTLFGGQVGSGRLADAASPAFGLGKVTLAPMFLDMQPNVRYLVWVWSWYVRSGPGGHFAFMKVKVPFITVDAGPPLNIR